MRPSLRLLVLTTLVLAALAPATLSTHAPAGVRGLVANALVTSGPDGPAEALLLYEARVVDDAPEPCGVVALFPWASAAVGLPSRILFQSACAGVDGVALHVHGEGVQLNGVLAGHTVHPGGLPCGPVLGDPVLGAGPVLLTGWFDDATADRRWTLVATGSLDNTWPTC